MITVVPITFFVKTTSVPLAQICGGAKAISLAQICHVGHVHVMYLSCRCTGILIFLCCA